MKSFTTFIPNPRWPEEVQKSDDLQDAVDDTTAKVVDSARTHAPVLTGALRDSIHMVQGKDGTDDVLADVPYAAYVEFGTRYTPAEPYLRPAADQVIGRE